MGNSFSKKRKGSKIPESEASTEEPFKDDVGNNAGPNQLSEWHGNVLPGLMGGQTEHSHQNQYIQKNCKVGNYQQQQFINNEQPILSNNGGCQTLPERNDVLQCSNPENIVGEIVVAHHDFARRHPSEVSFRQGDFLLVIKEENEDFLHARHLKTHEQGYIPRVFVCQEWFFENTSRKDAEINLMREPNKPGAFLVRRAGRGHPTHRYSISVRDNSKGGVPSIRHYKVYNKDGQIFCERDMKFPDLSHLLNYYKEPNRKNILNLRAPCNRVFQCYDVVDNWEVDRQEIDLRNQIGEGNFGDVWLGTMQGGQVQVAVKMLKNDSMSSDDFIAEASLMKKMQHKNILPLWGVCTIGEPILIITEFMNLGALLDVLRSKEKPMDTLKKRINAAYQIASGMAYLEEQNFIHRDLAARNVLVNRELDCKICDFGLARICQDEYSPENPKKFPVKWSAPEVLEFQTYSIKSDVWSFGIVLIEIFTDGAVPYPGMRNPEVISKVKIGYRMPMPMKCPKDLFQEIIFKCWLYTPEDRPTFDTIENYLDSYDPTTDTKYDNTDFN